MLAHSSLGLSQQRASNTIHLQIVSYKQIVFVGAGCTCVHCKMQTGNKYRYPHLHLYNVGQFVIIILVCIHF